MTKLSVKRIRHAINRQNRAEHVSRVAMPILEAAGAIPDEVTIRPYYDYDGSSTTLVHFTRGLFVVVVEVDDDATDQYIRRGAEYLADKIEKAPKRQEQR
jgi:hypothetical protein